MLLARWCERCCRAWAVAAGAKCPNCEAECGTVDIMALAEGLAEKLKGQA